MDTNLPIPKSQTAGGSTSATSRSRPKPASSRRKKVDESDGWSNSDEGKVGTNIPQFEYDKACTFLEDLQSLNTDQPLLFYKEMMPDAFIELIVEQSRLYAEQNKSKYWSKWQTEVTVDNLRVVEGSDLSVDG